MLGAVVDDMTALAESGQIGVCVVAGVVIAMGGGQYDPCRSNAGEYVIDPES